MSSSEKATHSLETQLSDLPVDEVIALFARQAAEMGFGEEISEAHNRRYLTPFGKLEIQRATDSVKLLLRAASHQALYQFKESVEHLLEHHFGASKVAVRWVGDLAPNAPPPNFCEVTIVASRLVHGIFQRVTVTANGIERFFKGALHFRLLLPKHPNGAVIWPYLDKNGKTIWPEGEAELRKPIYTVRQYDAQAGTIDFDVFLHDGGPTADWARSVTPGEKVGLMGPAGGWIPEGDFMLLAGDETAVPAICRILEEIPASTKGHVIISTQKGDDALPIPILDNMTLARINRQNDDHESLLTAAKEVELPDDQSVFVWLAAHKTVARKARQHFRDENGLTGKNSYLAAYWDD